MTRPSKPRSPSIAISGDEPGATFEESGSAHVLDGVLGVYRAARTMAAPDFAERAFSWMQARVPFDRGVMVTTRSNVAWVDAHFFRVPDPRALMTSYEAVRHLDKQSAKMLSQPMRAVRQDRETPETEGPEMAPLRDHLERFGCRFAACLSIPSEDGETTTVLMLVRGETGRRFEALELRSFEAMAPHVVEASATNRSSVLTRAAGRVADALPVALADGEGRLVMSTPSFVRLFWPKEPAVGVYLPDEARKALHKGRAWPLPHGGHSLHAQPDDDGTGFLLSLRPAGALDELTRRERQIAELFAAGSSYKAIAEKLGVAPVTVRSHLQNLYAKLGVTNREELVALLARAPE